MRCPECSQRNSVAAKACTSCGAKFQRKQITLTKKLMIVGGVILLGSMAYVCSIVPKLADPTENLASVAKRMTAGPKSAEDARKMKAEFADALKNLLLKIGADNSVVIAKKLQSVLSDPTFEVHVIDLPKGLKLVEIDTILQAADLLVMKGTSDTRVFMLSGMEVFDDARTVNDQAGPVLVLLGHTSGQMPHRPQLKTYALLPDFIEDESEKMVPFIKGEGTAKFMKGSSDIEVESSLISMAQADGIRFIPAPSADLFFRQALHWHEARYVPELRLGKDSTSYLFVLARCLRHPELSASLPGIIGGQAMRLVKEQGSAAFGNITIQKSKAKNNPLSFQIVSDSKDIDLILRKTGNGWDVAQYKVTEKTSVAQNNSVAPVKIDVVPNEEPPIAAVVPPVQETNKVGPVPSTNTAPVAVPVPVSTATNGKIDSNISSVSVRFRSGPSTNANTLLEIPRGTPIQILGKEKDWYKVNYGGKTGYIFGELVDDGKPKPVSAVVPPKETLKPPAPEIHAPEPAPAPSPSSASGTATVTRPWSLRDDNRRILDRARVGESVTILGGVKNHKYKVRLSNGSTGWLDQDALDVKGSGGSRPSRSGKKRGANKGTWLDMPEFVP